jgi:hypothetical protein
MPHCGGPRRRPVPARPARPVEGSPEAGRSWPGSATAGRRRTDIVISVNATGSRYPQTRTTNPDWHLPILSLTSHTALISLLSRRRVGEQDSSSASSRHARNTCTRGFHRSLPAAYTRCIVEGPTSRAAACVVRRHRGAQGHFRTRRTPMLSSLEVSLAGRARARLHVRQHHDGVTLWVI